MNQTKKDRVKDAEKKRREYLRKTAADVGLVVFVGLLFGYIAYQSIGILADLWRESRIRAPSIPAVVLLALLILFFGLACGYTVFLMKVSYRPNPYVPPVAEQIAALPAEEILVRGSDQPTGAPDELLRAAHAMDETPVQELLRPTKNIPT